MMGRSLKVAFFLAKRAVGRGHIRVSILSIAVLVLVYINIVLGPAMIDGLVDLINDKVRSTLIGDIVVQPDAGEGFIPDADALASQIEAIDGVEAAVPLNMVGYQIRYEGRQFTSSLTAADPTDYETVFTTSEYMIEGSFLDPDDTDQIVLGLNVAGADRDFDASWASLRSVNAGDKVLVVFTDGVEKEYTVKGVFRTEMPYSDIKAFITSRELSLVSPEVGDSATHLCVRTENGRELGPIIGEIQALREGLSVGTWEEAAGMIKVSVESVKSIYVIIEAIALVVAGLTVAMVTYIDLANRRKQIGIQRAIGITKQTIILTYAFRAFFLFAVGTTVASSVFVFIIVPLERQHPVHFSFGYILFPVDVPYLAAAAVLLGIVSLLSAAIPAWQATRVQVVDAIWAS
jgi:putative ABC transport system permease protein